MTTPPSRGVVTVNEASVIISASLDAIRSDIDRHVITPLRAEIHGANRPVFGWADLPCLAVLYHDDLFSGGAHIRKEAFRIFRNRFFRGVIIYVDPVDRADDSRARSAAFAWECAVNDLHAEFRGLPRHGARVRDSLSSERELCLMPIGDYVNVDLDLAINRIAPKARLFANGLDRLETDPDRMGGAPVFIGTRLPVHHIGLMYKNGAPKEEILEDYPALSDADVEFSRLFVEANPPRGRPAKLKGNAAAS